MPSPPPSVALPKVAFIGLGTMGSRMARRLLAAGYPLSIHNRTQEKAAPLIAAGASWADTPAQAASSADVVISMVADDGASRALWLGHDGALANLRPGTLAIECSTLSPAWISDLGGAVSAAEGALVDAPVAGSIPQAEAGELTFMVGGDPAAVERARSILAILGRKIVNIGGPGSGARAKLLNNFLNAVQIASFAEALALMDRSGIDRERALEVILQGSPGSPMLNTLYGRIKSGDPTAYFQINLMAKDLVYVQEMGAAKTLALRTAAAAASVFQSAIAHGDGERDISSAVDQFQR